MFLSELFSVNTSTEPKKLFKKYGYTLTKKKNDKTTNEETDNTANKKISKIFDSMAVENCQKELLKIFGENNTLTTDDFSFERASQIANALNKLLEFHPLCLHVSSSLKDIPVIRWVPRKGEHTSNHQPLKISQCLLLAAAMEWANLVHGRRWDMVRLQGESLTCLPTTDQQKKLSQKHSMVSKLSRLGYRPLDDYERDGADRTIPITKELLNPLFEEYGFLPLELKDPSYTHVIDKDIEANITHVMNGKPHQKLLIRINDALKEVNLRIVTDFPAKPFKEQRWKLSFPGLEQKLKRSSSSVASHENSSNTPISEVTLLWLFVVQDIIDRMDAGRWYKTQLCKWCGSVFDQRRNGNGYCRPRCIKREKRDNSRG